MATFIRSNFKPLNDASARRIANARRYCAKRATDDPNPPHSKAQSMTRNAQVEAREVVEAYYDAYNRRDIPQLLGLFDDDVVYHDMAVYEDPFVGIDELAAYFVRMERPLRST